MHAFVQEPQYMVLVCVFTQAFPHTDPFVVQVPVVHDWQPPLALQAALQQRLSPEQIPVAQDKPIRNRIDRSFNRRIIGNDDNVAGDLRQETAHNVNDQGRARMRHRQQRLGAAHPAAPPARIHHQRQRLIVSHANFTPCRPNKKGVELPFGRQPYPF